MSADTLNRKKRTIPDGENSAPQDDHRKRRRNRTTQSCLNCHTSKRMCDRKRPCGRCTQLGLTGLCVYEIDDPNQRSDPQDEGSRLRSRVAELEGVIRELKNKPHPKWARLGCNPVKKFEKWHSRAQNRSGDDSPTSDVKRLDASPPPRMSIPSNERDSLFLQTKLSITSADPFGAIRPIEEKPHTFSSTLPPYCNISSPSSSPSPSTLTPTDNLPQSFISVVGPHETSQDFDFSSNFMSYPGFSGCGENTFGQIEQTGKENGQYNNFPYGHCGCLDEHASYNVLLELSLRIRNASDMLLRSPAHSLGTACSLTRRISELDNFATNVLGSISTPPGNASGVPLSQIQVVANNHAPGAMFGPGARTSLSAPIPQPSHPLRPWGFASPISDSPLLCNDSLIHGNRAAYNGGEF